MNRVDAERIQRLARALAAELNKHAANSTNANNLIEHLEYLGGEIENILDAFDTSEQPQLIRMSMSADNFDASEVDF